MTNLLVIELDSGSTFIGDTLVSVTIPQLKLEVDMDREESVIKGNIEDAYIICFEQEANRMIEKYKIIGR